MKKQHGLLLLTGLAAITLLAGCNNDNTSSSGTDNTAEIAVVTDVGSLKDGGFNEGTYNGAKNYAEAHGKTYAYYQPANGSTATDDDRIAAMTLAVENGAKIIVAPGYLQATAMKTVATANPDVKFVFVDGSVQGLKNITAITYKEQEAGFMAGYAAYAEGYRKLGGTFGGGGSNPACNRFAYGYVQGISAAANAAKSDDAEVKISFMHGDNFSASTDLQTQIAAWYKAGTEVVFSCGGSMVQSVISAANNYSDAKIIGVDTDQSALSPKVITSAMKGLTASVEKILGEFYDGKWDTDLADKASNLGAADNATGLPTADGSWRFTKFTKTEYNVLFNSIASGVITPSADVPADVNNSEFWKNAANTLGKMSITFEK